MQKREKGKPEVAVKPSYRMTTADGTVGNVQKTKKEKNEKKQKTGSINRNVKVKHAVANKSVEPLFNEVKVVASAPEPVGMQIYWNLSNVDASERSGFCCFG
jgi:hypothetical protein